MSLTSANKIETNKYELEVEVSGKDFSDAIQKAYMKNKNRINVPGFRKGKAPRAFIEKMYGKEFFYDDAVNSVYPSAYSEAVDKAGIEPVDRADVEIISASQEEGLKFKATVTVKPEVEIADYKGVTAEKREPKVTPEDVEAELNRMRERNARIVDVDDRAAQDGDIAVIDFEGYVDGETFEGGSAEKFSLALGSGQFIPGFEGQVVGHSIGEEFEVLVTFPEDYHAADLRGQETTFKVKLHELKFRQLPEADDEFAKDVSEFDTLEDLKKDLEKKLMERAEHMVKDDFEDKVIDAVIANMKAEIPDVMIEHAIDNNVQDTAMRLQNQGLNLQTYLQYMGMELDAFRDTFREKAEKQVKVRLALEKIARLEELEISDAELQEEFETMAKSYGVDVERIKNAFPAEDLKSDLLIRKAVDLVRDSAVAVPASEEKPEDAKTEETKE